MKSYNDFWSKKGKSKKWKHFILPRFTDEQFDLEGKLQADYLNDTFIENEYSVLEFGCGIGRILKHIKSKNKIGVDVCQEFLDKIKDKSIEKIKTDGITIKNVKKDSIDFIYSLMVFQHISKKDHQNLLSQLFSLLKKNGTMLIQFPTDPNNYYRQGSFVNIFKETEIQELCKSSKIKNFKIEKNNLVGYGDGLTTKDTELREYFLIIKK